MDVLDGVPLDTLLNKRGREWVSFMYEHVHILCMCFDDTTESCCVVYVLISMSHTLLLLSTLCNRFAQARP